MNLNKKDYFKKRFNDFKSKLNYHEYLKSQLFEILKEEDKKLSYIMEYPPDEPYGIDIMGLLTLIGKEREIIAI